MKMNNAVMSAKQEEHILHYFDALIEEWEYLDYLNSIY